MAKSKAGNRANRPLRVTNYLGWQERTNKWFVCVNCFENTEACAIFNKATNFIADRRVRPPPYKLRKVLGWYVQDVTRDLIRFLVGRRQIKRRPVLSGQPINDNT